MKTIAKMSSVHVEGDGEEGEDDQHFRGNWTVQKHMTIHGK